MDDLTNIYILIMISLHRRMKREGPIEKAQITDVQRSWENIRVSRNDLISSIFIK